MTQVAAREQTAEPGEITPINHWIGGKRVAGRSGRSGPVYNPATGQQTGAVDFASVEEVDLAVRTAKEAFPAWRATSLSKRTEILFQMRRIFDERRTDIAKILTAEHGKVLSDALGEVARGLEVVEFACGIPTLLKGGYSEQASTGIDVYSIRQPVGVVGGITPFNFPAMVPMWMFAPAIACGNTFVLKPSEKDPSASLLLAELLRQAGVPDGVFNVVHGDKVAVDALLEHPDVGAISFVGSGYGSAGERCMAISVVVTVGDVAEPLIEAIKERIPKIKVGDGMEPDVEMGPLITREHRDRVASYLDKGPEEGATVVADGRDLVNGDGFFLGPSLLDHVEPGTACYAEEIFGPVLSVVRAETYEDAVRMVSENSFGNGTAIFTRDGGVRASGHGRDGCGAGGGDADPLPHAGHADRERPDLGATAGCSV